MTETKLPYCPPDRIADAIGGISYNHMDRPWRSRSYSTQCNWVGKMRLVVPELSLLEVWAITPCLYAACAARLIGGTRYNGRNVTPAGWQSIAALFQDFLESKPPHAFTRPEYESQHPRLKGTKGRRA